MRKKIFVSGSIAYDLIMQYKGIFYDTMLQEHLEHLNIAFTAHNKRVHFGGCCGNIAYNLKLLDVNPLPYGMAGMDFVDYEKWLKKNKISTKYIGRVKDDYTATAYVLTDDNENQITFFAPGAMENEEAELELTEVDFLDIELAILSPDICKRTVKIAHQLIENQIPYIFDPGQMTHAFEFEDLKFLLKNAFGYIANHYETGILCKRLSYNIEDIVNKVHVFVETLGEKGAILRQVNNEHHIPIAKPKEIVDPTGCGDGFRAGFLSGIIKGYDYVKCCKMGALLSTYVIENSGTQGHKFKMKEFAKRFQENFSESL
jgi:adenosine kinase